MEELNKQDKCSEEASTSTSEVCIGTSNSDIVPDFKKKWERAFIDCFQKVDDEVGGKLARGDTQTTPAATNPEGVLEPVAPETAGSTAVVAVICSSHIIVANCGDSRAVLCRGKQAMPLSVDHKVRSVLLFSLVTFWEYSIVVLFLFYIYFFCFLENKAK
jgi:Protein phosphatase 2C